ncbi:MAG: hypothetical protein ACREBU_04375 [Nitrososphaera sp.]
MKWLTDARSNKCSVEYFGSEEAAQKALNSLVECDNCINCSGCSDCSRCSDCSGCSNIAALYSKKNLSEDPESAWNGAPPVPAIENIHAKMFVAVSGPGALNMGNWHTCDTRHCRGGWVVALAGDAGRALESFHNTLLAAQLIYKASGYEINPRRFYDSNEDAMADMARLAAAQS